MAELSDHRAASWCTLTYEDRYCPPTLVKSHLTDAVRELRRFDRFRYLACGEYGELRGRPHYHLIAFGLEARQLRAGLSRVWRVGLVDVDEVTPDVVSYVAGYVQKKCAGWQGRYTREVQVSEWGEEFLHQPPFRAVSRRPGLGSSFIRRYAEAWREHIVWNGKLCPPPRFARLIAEESMSEAEVAERRYYRDDAAAAARAAQTWQNPRHDENSERISRARAAEVHLKRRL